MQGDSSFRLEGCLLGDDVAGRISDAGDGDGVRDARGPGGKRSPCARRARLPDPPTPETGRALRSPSGELAASICFCESTLLSVPPPRAF